MFYTRLKNISLENVKEVKVVQILEQYFPGDVASIGAITRKIALLLLDLSAVTGTSWYATCCEDKDKPQLITAFYQKSSFGTVRSFTFTHSMKRVSNTHSLEHMLRQMFQKDKWAENPSSSCVVVELLRKDGKYLYTKSRKIEGCGIPNMDYSELYNRGRYLDGNKVLFFVSIERRSLSIWERLCNFFKSTNNLPRSGVIDYVVLEN